MFARKALWYLSVTFLIFTTSFCLLRWLLFLALWIVGIEFWIFPRLFDESLSFLDSFKPIYTIERGTPGQGYYRMGLLTLVLCFVYWAYSQPTGFDELVQAQKSLIDDLYAGNLLPDAAQAAKDNMNRMRTGSRVPNLEDLIKQIEHDEKEAIAEASSADDGAASQMGGETAFDTHLHDAQAEVEPTGNMNMDSSAEVSDDADDVDIDAFVDEDEAAEE